jgi:inosine-uridine nucleoside N-ribohydrolase
VPIPVIIDTDPGIDDALALALALRAPELDVLAVSTVYGNAPAAVTTRNARYLLERLNRTEVPLLGGASHPLVRAPSHALETHGEAGLGYATVPELPAGPHQNEAPVGLLALLAQSRTPVTLIALGPLTNVALALALDRERCRRSIREIIWMGGSAGAPGNTTPVSEWNAWCDPEAARAVLEAEIPVRMVGLDATRSVLLGKAAVQELGRRPDPEVRWWAEMWRFYVEFHERSESLAGCIMNDPLAVMALLRPDLLHWQEMYVEVDCGWGLTRGQTLCDRFGFTGKPANASVCLHATGEEALAVILQRALGMVL